MAVEEDDGGGGIPEWVVTFGDMMSLLLTFFIMLASLSEIKDEQRYQAMLESITRRFGYDTTSTSLAPGSTRARNAAIAKLASAGRAKRKDTMRGGDKVQAPQGEFPRVRVIRPGQKTHIGTVIFFREGSAKLTEAARRALQVESREIGGKPQKIELRGHTTRRPLADDSNFQSHWQLAYQRCWVTFRYLVDQLGIDPRRIRISVAGPHEPLHITADETSFRENPRVEVFLLDEVVSDLMGTEQQQQSRFTDQDIP
jgi:chemotaxis protein MotB